MSAVLEARSAAVNQGRRVLLPLTSVRVTEGRVSVVHGPPGSAHAALALVLAGRMRLDHGTVTLDDDALESRLQAAVALVDVPEVNEPDDLVPWRVIVAEELAMAGYHSGPAAVRDWLADLGFEESASRLTQDVPGEVRSDTLLHLGAARPGVRFVVWPLPERLGIHPDRALELAQQLADEGLGVLVTTTHPVASREVDSYELGPLWPTPEDQPDPGPDPQATQPSPVQRRVTDPAQDSDAPTSKGEPR